MWPPQKPIVMDLLSLEVLENQGAQLRLSLLVFGVPVRGFEPVTSLALNETPLPTSSTSVVVPSLYSRTKRWLC